MVGAEVRYFPGIGRAQEISRLCVRQTRTLLLETPFEQWTESMLRDVRDLIERQRLNLVLAHVERYPEFQHSRRIWEHVLALSLTPQLNAGSFLGRDRFLRKDRFRHFCLDFLAERPDTIIGTDCHNLSGRRPNLSEARAVIAEALGEAALDRIDDTTRTALKPTDEGEEGRA